MGHEHRRAAELPCALFAALNRLVSADEQRHHQFGLLMLECLYPQLSPHERRQMKEWTQELSLLWKEARGSTVPGQADDVLAKKGPSRKLVKQTSAYVAIPLGA
jgi:hypothetical protein